MCAKGTARTEISQSHKCFRVAQIRVLEARLSANRSGEEDYLFEVSQSSGKLISAKVSVSETFFEVSSRLELFYDASFCFFNQKNIRKLL